MCFLATTITDSTGDDRKMTHAVKDVLDEYENYIQHTSNSTSNNTTNSNSNTSNSSSNNNYTLHAMRVRLTSAEERKVFAMRQRVSLLKDLTSCIAPNIFKHEVVKLGLLLQMVGGVSKTTV